MVTIKVAWTKIHEKSITSAVIKDGGDDPDVTHGAEICSTVESTSNKGEVQIIGGTGVGKGHKTWPWTVVRTCCNKSGTYENDNRSYT